MKEGNYKKASQIRGEITDIERNISALENEKGRIYVYAGNDKWPIISEETNSTIIKALKQRVKELKQKFDKL